MEVRTIGR